MWPQVSWEAPFMKLSFASQSVCCWSFHSEGELWKLQVRFATSVTDFLLSYTAVMWSCYTEISWELLVRHLAQNIKIASSGLWTSHLLSYTETVLDDKGLHKAVKGHGCILCTRLHFFIFINLSTYMASWNTLPNIYCYWALLIKKMNKPQISLIAVVFILFKKFGPPLQCSVCL